MLPFGRGAGNALRGLHLAKDRLPLGGCAGCGGDGGPEGIKRTRRSAFSTSTLILLSTTLQTPSASTFDIVMVTGMNVHFRYSQASVGIAGLGVCFAASLGRVMMAKRPPSGASRPTRTISQAAIHSQHLVRLRNDAIPVAICGMVGAISFDSSSANCRNLKIAVDGSLRKYCSANEPSVTRRASYSARKPKFVDRISPSPGDPSRYFHIPPMMERPGCDTLKP